jgi:uncharacterized RDD family membrane protein YckC
MNYAGFWPRLGANLVDILIFLPLGILMLEVGGISRVAYVGTSLFGLALALVLRVWMVQRFGGSPGKLVVGLRVRLLDGAPVTWRAAWLRYSVDLAFGIASTIVALVALAGVTEAQYVGLGFIDRGRLLRENEPNWARTVMIMSHIWIWSELLVLLTNKKRRALHDFIAGTVVIKLDRAPMTAAEEIPAA